MTFRTRVIDFPKSFSERKAVTSVVSRVSEAVGNKNILELVIDISEIFVGAATSRDRAGGLRAPSALKEASPGITLILR